MLTVYSVVSVCMHVHAHVHVLYMYMYSMLIFCIPLQRSLEKDPTRRKGAAVLGMSHRKRRVKVCVCVRVHVLAISQ